MCDFARGSPSTEACLVWQPRQRFERHSSSLAARSRDANNWLQPTRIARWPQTAAESTMPVPFTWRGQHARLAWRATKASRFRCFAELHTGVPVARRAFSDHAASAAMLPISARRSMPARTRTRRRTTKRGRRASSFIHRDAGAPEFRLIWHAATDSAQNKNRQHDLLKTRAALSEGVDGGSPVGRNAACTRGLPPDSRGPGSPIP